MGLLDGLTADGTTDPDLIGYAERFDAFMATAPGWKDFTADFISQMVDLLNEYPFMADAGMVDVLLMGLKAIALGARDAESIAVATMSIVIDPQGDHTLRDLLCDDDG